MTVWLWIEDIAFGDDQYIEVFATAEAAMQAHPAPAGRQWVEDPDSGAWWMQGCPIGYSVHVKPHQVKGA